VRFASRWMFGRPASRVKPGATGLDPIVLPEESLRCSCLYRNPPPLRCGSMTVGGVLRALCS
jgi:hypothetical protein